MTKRRKERGSAMLVTMIIIAALLAGAAVLASMQLSSNRSTELTRHGLASLYCAEAGITAAREFVKNNYDKWNAALTVNCGDGDCRTVIQPSWLDNAAFNHDLDQSGEPGFGVADFVVSIRDNDDELSGSQDGAKDIDDKVFIVSRCVKYPDTPKQVEELIFYRVAMNCYTGQEAGCNSRSNSNDNRP